jgi:hypothetical protein
LLLQHPDLGHQLLMFLVGGRSRGRRGNRDGGHGENDGAGGSHRHS